MFENISIIGDGAMGAVLAMLLCEKREAGHEVRMWGYDAEQLGQIEQNRENKKFLPGYKLPEALMFEPDDKRIMAGADLIISAVPCQYMRRVWNRLKNYVPENVPIISVAKGIENDTLLRPTQILAEILRFAQNDKEWQNDKLAVLSGPTIADELARKLPATACAACGDGELAKKVQYTFNTQWLRVYTNTDIVGVELAGATKNIIAIAAGIIDGAGAGDNAKAALLSRGLAEITRLGLACGAKPQTFAGLSVIEGVATCKSVIALAKRNNVEMPITRAVYEVLFENKGVPTAISDLMERELKAE
jgi:glycerol-3-phosphate dehydrogenase (NAD(P)+)